MELLNRLIMAVDEAGLRVDSYGTINTISNYCAYIFGFLHGRKLKTGFFAVLIAVCTERFLAGPLMSAILFMQNGFQPTMQANAIVVFPYVPLTAFLVSRLLKRSWKEMWDVMMPVPIVMFAGARVACTFTGCCRGYPCSWGVYNPVKDEILFPIQLVEALLAVLILVFVLWREKKNNYETDGRNVPIILISYGIGRFFLEFLHNNEKLFWELNKTSFNCLFMILVGVIALLIIRRSEKPRTIAK